jgi:hypothetical protein
MIFAVGVVDLVIASLIAIATLLIGQAIAAYEVFTGRTLPRRGLIRRWRDAVILAIGFSMLVAASLTLKLHAIHIIFVATALVTIFYALYGWRSYAERDRYIRDLRPFVTSQNLYDHLVHGSAASSDLDAKNLFRVLCRDVLNARSAYLIALGPLAPFVPSMAYPDPAAMIPTLPPIQFDSVQRIGMPVDPARYAGAQWAVPLWSERGQSGVLLLGEKSDGGVYAQEEIEIAGASGARLIDTMASSELARRLMLLQRQKLAETGIVDRRARRILHDNVLPQLHAAMLTLNDTSRTVDLLTTAHREISQLVRDMPPVNQLEVAQLGLISALRDCVDAEWSDTFDCVIWNVAPDVEVKVGALEPVIAETIFMPLARQSETPLAARKSRSLNLRISACR